MKRLLIIPLLFIFAICESQTIINASPPLRVIASAGAPSTLLDNLIGVWEFEEADGDALDDVGSDDGTVTECTREETGKIGYCYGYDASNDKVTFGSTTFAAQHGSISVWAKAATTYRQGGIYNWNFGNNGIDYRWIGFEDTKFTSVLQGTTVQDGATNGDWNHIVLTYDATLGSNNIKLYINGSLISQGNETDNISNEAAITGYGAGDYFGGNIDLLRTWSITLTQEQITELYTKENAGTTYPW